MESSAVIELLESAKTRSGGTLRRVLTVFLAGMLLIIAATFAGAADLVNHGGPILKSFQVVPYYYGPWTSADIVAHQNYLVGLTQYITGANAKANSQTMLVQYGVTSAGVASPVTNSMSTPISLDT